MVVDCLKVSIYGAGGVGARLVARGWCVICLVSLNRLRRLPTASVLGLGRRDGPSIHVCGRRTE